MVGTGSEEAQAVPEPLTGAIPAEPEVAPEPLAEAVPVGTGATATALIVAKPTPVEAEVALESELVSSTQHPSFRPGW